MVTFTYVNVTKVICHYLSTVIFHSNMLNAISCKIRRVVLPMVLLTMCRNSYLQDKVVFNLYSLTANTKIIIGKIYKITLKLLLFAMPIEGHVSVTSELRVTSETNLFPQN